MTTTSRRLARSLLLATLVAFVAGPTIAADSSAPPADNPLRTADEPTRTQARTEAWETFQRSCSPCHGTIGAGDGPYAAVAARPASDLRRPSRDIIGDAVRFTRIRDGAASLRERPWDSNMPAFGDTLDTRQIWGLVLLLADLGNRGSGLPIDASGADIYASRCAVCHGAKGAGDGPLASELFPAPRDLAHGPYRFRSTAFGVPPLENDLMITTASGLSNTAMGAFLSLGGATLDELHLHVMSLAPTLFSTTPEIATGSPMPMLPITELAASGRAVYEKAGCGDCHGATGRGNGPKGATLKDDAGRPAIPTDLTKKWHQKRGGGSPSVFQILTTGMTGTPMVSYAETLSGDDRWRLAYYVERLARNRPRYNPTVLASIGTAQIPADPADDFWNRIPTTFVALGPQIEHAPFWTQPAVDIIEVKVAARGDELGFLLTWNDRTRDVRNDDAGKIPTVAAALQRYGAWQLPDRIALQFPEKLDPKGTLPDAYAGAAARPVRRWIWSADRTEAGEPKALIDRAAGPRAEPEVLTDAPPVETSATYVDGQWHVLFRGKRPAKADALPVAFQAWDGSAGEAGRWQSFSTWVTVNLK